jgi:hypothetical protein
VKYASKNRVGWVFASLVTALVVQRSVPNAQTVSFGVVWGDERDPTEAMVGINADDDNDDGVPDLAEVSSLGVATDNDISEVSVQGVSTGAVRVSVTGGLRLVTPTGVVTEATVAVVGRRATVGVMGVAVSAQPRDAAIVFTAGGVTKRVEITVVSVGLLRGDNTPLYAHRDAVGLSHEITTNDTLPRNSTWENRSDDLDNVRVEVWDPASSGASQVRIESLGTPVSIGVTPDGLRAQLASVPVVRPVAGVALRSRFVRLVGDDLDLRAPGVQGQTLLVGLRDRVRVRYARPGVAGSASVDLRVGRPGNEDGPLAARRAHWRVLVLRHRGTTSGPVVGDTDVGALRIARRQVEIANEVYLQCSMTWGDPATADVAVVDVPRDVLLSVGDNDGLASAGGTIRFTANRTVVGPVRVAPGLRPVETARAIATAMRAQGFVTHVTENARTDYGAFGSADIVARDRQGRLVTFAPVGTEPLTSDRMQRLAIGRVDLSDGIEEFNNLNSATGTLEERTLVKPLADDNPGTIELFVINRFTRGTRIGEAFVEGAHGAVHNGLLIDRAGISAEREAWTQSHEAGHILLDQPWHPDNMGPDRPWLLMDADANLAAVTGPKRLTAEECARIHQRSGVQAVPALFERYDVVARSPRAAEFVRWPAEPLYVQGSVTTPSATDGGSGGSDAVADPSGHELGVTLFP